MPRRARSAGPRRPISGVALDGRPVGLLDGAQPGGDPCLSGSNGPAVALAVGAFEQAVAEALDLADVGLALAGMGGDSVEDDVSSGSVQDEADRLGFGVPADQGEYAGGRRSLAMPAEAERGLA
jgi:hypothetical protein